MDVARSSMLTRLQTVFLGGLRVGSKSQFSVIDSCDQLSDIVFKILGGASGSEPGQTLAIDEKFLHAVSNNTASHNIYFCQLDAIGKLFY